MNIRALYHTLVILLSSLSFNVEIQAQIISENSRSIENFKHAILSISEFKARFNADLDNEYSRRLNIESLLSDNINVPRSDLDLFISQISARMSVTLKGIELTTDAMLAKVEYRGIYIGDSCTSQMLLQKQMAGNKVWWELVDFWSPFVDSLFVKSQKLFIPPHAEELNFATLTTDRPDNYKFFTSYLSDDFSADPLSVLVTLVRTGQLKLKYASRTRLYITEFEGWILTLEQDTTGWKITDLKPSHQTSNILSLKNNHQ